MHMWHHVTNHLIISTDMDSNSENRIKLRVRDKTGPECGMPTGVSIREPDLVPLRSLKDPRKHAPEGTKRYGKTGNGSVPHCTQGGAPSLYQNGAYAPLHRKADVHIRSSVI
jgi:hypothetical protein